MAEAEWESKETGQHLLKRCAQKDKEFGECLSLLDRIAGDVMWAQDFTTVHEIKEWLEPILEAIMEMEDKVREEVDILEDVKEQIEFKLQCQREELEEEFGVI